MHAVIRKYSGARGVVDEARGKLAHLEQTMRATPGFVAYYFLETADGVATITITEDESGTTESMSRAANWVQQNLGVARSAGASRGHHRPGPGQRHPLAGRHAGANARRKEGP